MQRISAIDPAQATGKSKQLLDGVQAKLGMTPNLMKTLATSPAALEAYLHFGAALGTGSLDAKFREQIALTVAQANSCEYCLSAHSAIGKMARGDSSQPRSARRRCQASGWTPVCAGSRGAARRGVRSSAGGSEGGRVHRRRDHRTCSERGHQHLHQLLQPCGPHGRGLPESGSEPGSDGQLTARP
jgi:AhpD family alkylhydroperoxidase